ncbi:MAG: hypothetical protein ABJP45_18785 [Cyclobacteriaceae bacterium]
MKISVFSVLMLLSIGLAAQSNWTDRFYFGGGFGLSAGGNGTNVSLSPQVGYKVTDRYSVGVGITYQYVKIKGIDTSINNYGWSVFNRYNITRQFFAYSEFENLQFEYFTSLSPERTARGGYNSLLIGAGYSESLAGRASFNISALYNVLYDPADPVQPYNSPWVIRAGVGIGIF